MSVSASSLRIGSSVRSCPLYAVATVAVCIATLLLLWFKYCVESSRYCREQCKMETGQLPPRYPYFIPYIGSAIPFAWNTKKFLRRATSFRGELSASKVTFLGINIYLFQERETVKRIWRQHSLSSPISIYIFVLKYLFGVPESALAIYRADDSGPFCKPYSHSHVQPQDRVDYITHHPYSRAFSGPCLRPTTRRFIRSLNTRFDNMKWGNEWTNETSIELLFQEGPAASLIEAIFGPALLQLNPTFIEDMWKFDSFIPWFARAIPRFLMPEPYRLRKRLRDQLKCWYGHARQHFQESDISEDGDGDPFWGSELTRYRQRALLQLRKHDDDVVASTDIGLAWGAMGNTIPVAMLATIHIYRDAALLERVRASIQACLELGRCSLLELDPQILVQDPLLSSIYTEILRVYVNTYCLVSSPHLDVSLGKWRLPKGQMALLNSNISQMDHNFWNTQNGRHPTTSFWADRFIIDPANPFTGPISPAARKVSTGCEQNGKVGPYFSKKGTEGSFFPYGGGNSICPGRFLAKRAVLLTFALLVHDFDIELHGYDEIILDSFRFGLGVGQLQHAIPFRIRKRQVV